MKFRHKFAVLMILAALQMPCVSFAAEEDRELAPIAAEQPHKDEELGEINPALTEKISTERTQETDKDIKKRKKKLKQTRKEKEEINERKLKDSNKRKEEFKPSEMITIEPMKPELPQINDPVTPVTSESQPQVQKPPTIETTTLPDQKLLYANFTEVARAVKFIPLYMPRKSGYEIIGLYAQKGVAEVRYGRRWEPTVSLTVRTYKRAEGEELKDISGVTGVKWRIDTTTGTTIYIAKISDTQQVAAWAVGHYTFAAQAENLSFAGFHSLVADELVELSTHYYLDL